ncbi:MAG: SEL1-like repeat protein [Alphaproteobacteria bacterium]|nr:SEL1-like repeat protein [Alphaproteobacteria bacterium]MDE2337436.1 SEL1-like repeat protein [Alphaproteobacteria bacterium]
MTKIIALDFETANYPRSSAIALGLSVIDDDKITARKAWLFRPPANDAGGIYIRPDFIAIHGIRPVDLKDKPDFRGVWPEIEACLDGADLLIAHNAGFDRSVLHGVTAHYGLALPRFDWQCTVSLSRAAWPQLPNHKLPTVCEHLGIVLKHHDPASDADACARIFLEAGADVQAGSAAAYDRACSKTQNMSETVAGAQYRMGLRYLAGDGVAQNPVKARGCLFKAAEQGHEGARRELARLRAE